MLTFGTPPSQLNWLSRLRLKLIVPPAWVAQHGDAGMGWFLAAEKDLKQNGVVVPGTVIQANSELFHSGDQDLPGELLFSFAHTTTGETLKVLAGQLFQLKGKEFADQEKAFFSRYLASETDRVKGIELSRRLSPSAEAVVSSTIFYRAHLPGGVLHRTIYPVLASPQSRIAMVLPQQLWTADGRKRHDQFLNYDERR